MFKARKNPRVLIGDIITAKEEVDPADGTCDVTMLMDGKTVTIDFNGTWNLVDVYAYDDVTVGDYVLAYNTDENTDVTKTAEWMYVPAAVFNEDYLLTGA